MALWFALVVWTYRDAVQRSRNSLMQVFSTLIVVLFFIPGVVIYLLLRPRESLDERQQRWVEEEYLAQELDELSICPSCSRGVRDEWIYCPACRFQLRRACQACGRLVETGWEACAFCGVDLRVSAERTPHRETDAVEHAQAEVAVRPESWVDAIKQSLGGQTPTADAPKAMTENESVQHNGAAQGDEERARLDETGELPVSEISEIDTPALEGGARRRD